MRSSSVGRRVQIGMRKEKESYTTRSLLRHPQPRGREPLAAHLCNIRCLRNLSSILEERRIVETAMPMYSLLAFGVTILGPHAAHACDVFDYCLSVAAAVSSLGRRKLCDINHCISGPCAAYTTRACTTALRGNSDRSQEYGPKARGLRGHRATRPL
eukprot:scaffold1130_cov195-Pinguiococcus_pyrenoidosus.AAC.66